MKQQIELVCRGCKITFKKSLAEYKRNLKHNQKKHFCSLSCKAKHFSNGKGNKKNLKLGSEIDNFSPFRYFLKKIRERHKVKGFDITDIDLEFLKELWIKQNEICPITGWKLILPKSVSGWSENDPVVNRASLDRIICKQPYSKDNVRFIAYIANLAKHEFDDSDIVNFAEAVVKNNIK